MAVVALEDDDRAFLQSERIDFGQQRSQPLVLSGHERSIQVPRVRQLLEMLQPLCISLVRVVRCVQRVVDEEGTILVLLQKTRAFPDHQVRKILAATKHLDAVAVQVVDVGAAPVEEVRVVVDTAAHVAEAVVESLGIRHRFRRVAQVPLANMRRDVPSGLEHLRHRDFRLRQCPLAAPLRRTVARHASAERVAPGQQARPRRRAHRCARIELRKPHPSRRQCIHVRRVQILGPVAAQVHAPLVIRHDHDHARLRGQRCPGAEHNDRPAKPCRAHPDHQPCETSASPQQRTGRAKG